MGQVTIYIEDETEVKMRAAAKSQHLSQSKWISNLIKEKIADQWPQSVIDLAGAWKDFPTAEEMRASQGKNQTRETL